jgi:hypothetical protein
MKHFCVTTAGRIRSANIVKKNMKINSRCNQGELYSKLPKNILLRLSL